MATTNPTASRTVTKKEVVDRICAETGLRRNDVRDVVQAFLDQIVEEVGKGNRLEFRDFGVFEVKRRAPRVAQNPKTLERVQVPAKRTVKFKIGRLMRQRLEAADEAERTDTRDRDSAAAPHVEVRLAESGTVGVRR